MSNRPKTGNMVAMQQSVLTHSGPLPPAAEFERYERALPGTAEKIVSMAEKEADCRRRIDERLVDSIIKTRSIGQWTAFVVAMSALVIAGICAVVGQQIASVGLAITACVGLAAVFIKRAN